MLQYFAFTYYLLFYCFFYNSYIIRHSLILSFLQVPKILYRNKKFSFQMHPKQREVPLSTFCTEQFLISLTLSVNRFFIDKKKGSVTNCILKLLNFNFLMRNHSIFLFGTSLLINVISICVKNMSYKTLINKQILNRSNSHLTFIIRTQLSQRIAGR